jgi:hypothetical protein
MKKAFTLILAIAFSLIQSFGQISIGVKGGLNLSNVKNIGSANNKTRLGFNSGLITEIAVGKKFIIQPELLYSIKGFKFTPTTFNSGGTLSFNYVSFPLLSGYRITDNFIILLGPEFSFLTSANSRFDGSNHDVLKNFRKFDLGIDLGATYNIKNGFGAELRYSYGFEDLADVTVTDLSGNLIGKRKVGSNRVFQFGLFYKIRKNK